MRLILTVDQNALTRNKCLVVLCLYLFPLTVAGAQTQTTGRIAGSVRDAQGAAIVGAEVVLENLATSSRCTSVTDETGSYSAALLPPDSYDVTVRAVRFNQAVFRGVRVGPSETVTVNASLQIAQSRVEVVVSDAPPLVRSDGPELASTLETRTLEALPLPTRNFLQLLTLAPGVSAPLTNNNTIGRNSPNVSVNGSRVTSNNYQINGIDGNDVSLHVLTDVAVPAPESVSEVNVQTSLYDATVAGAGGSVQVLTKSGSNSTHGSVYEYFRNEALDANDANLNAVGEGRPAMRRNVYGATLGGPLRTNRAFFFTSCQGTREVNGATDQSLYKDVLITPGLSNDRSAATLMKSFGVASVDPISLKLLSTKLPSGQFLIPTPQTPDGLITGSALSTYREEQFNTNVDFRLGTNDLLAAKFFFAHAPLFSALARSNFGSLASLPGFGNYINIDNRVLSLQQTHTFTHAVVNEARLGYSFLRHDEVPQESVQDSSIGMERLTAEQYPGLPMILLGRDEGGASIGTSDITYRGHTSSLSFADILSVQRANHNIRFGGEILHLEWRVRAAVNSYGEIDFPTFRDFLIGNTGSSQFLDPPTQGFAHLGTGLTDRDFITTDYRFFVQDDWKVLSKLTVNLGLRYEIDPFPYDSQGRIGGFDPALYQPRMQLDDGSAVGPPAEGIIEAGNAPSQFSLAGVTRVGKRIVKNLDTNNFGPRIGLAWALLGSGRLAIRAGYGIFYARPSFIYLGLEYFAPPFFLDSETSGQPFSHPFATAPLDSRFPLIEPGASLSATVIDRNARTPYVQQFNASVQYELQRNTTLQIAYAGTRGVKLFRSVGINQARIASLDHPIFNVVTGVPVTNNTLDNASLRAPLQGVDPGSFALNKSAAQSSYDSLQVDLKRHFAHGLQFSIAYTFSKSIDNASSPGGGANSDGTLDRSGGLDSGGVWGEQLSSRANRGLSDFDRTHYLVFDGIWNLPQAGFASRFAAGQALLWNWRLSTIVTAMSGLPVDILDPAGGSLYGLLGARPDWAAGASRTSATIHVPAGYYFNPTAFAEATVQKDQPIPSANDPTALAGMAGTDIGNVGRNVLRGPAQSNVDFSIGKFFPLSEAKGLEFRADFFNALNHPNRDNPISDITSSDFGKILSFSSSPRIVQFAVKVTF